MVMSCFKDLSGFVVRHGEMLSEMGGFSGLEDVHAFHEKVFWRLRTWKVGSVVSKSTAVTSVDSTLYHTFCSNGG